ncbi:hypothetical protein QC762_201510 [Podospora pseudocomata]|uniref:C2H2-type domain-containing protein n=1 Tax=Podospora pseudocomata TaxID=2093779 RepID=A0ABR0GQI4_9PEZI|nr:hypothetical protein QC762_201510 [Podospora pseudocomata]
MSQLPRYSFAHLAEHAPTSDSSQMAGMTRPSGVGINNYSAYAMMQDNLGGLSTYGNRHVPPQNMMASTLNASDFLKNYRIVKNSQLAIAPVSWRDSDFTAPIYTEYRNNAPPSEAETLVSPTGGKLVSDSGYGSQTIRSVGNPSSVYNGDVDNPETQNITQQFSRYGLSQVTTEDRPRRRDARSQRAGSTTSTANNLRCLDCPQLTFKTNSELRKHKARHEKPFKCDMPDCPKATEGFSTNNDLDRHRAGVHRIYKSDAPVYQCVIDSCKDKNKTWPRPDNFRQHLKRVHHKENMDLSNFLYRCVTFGRPDISGASVASEHAPSEAGTHSTYAGQHASWSGLGHGQPVTSLSHHVPDEPAVIQPQHLMYRSSMSQPDYSALMNASGFHSHQSQTGLDDPRIPIEMDLQGLNIPHGFQQQVEPPVQEQTLEQPGHVSPDILTGAGSGLLPSMDEAGEMHAHPAEVIQIDDDTSPDNIMQEEEEDDDDDEFAEQQQQQQQPKNEPVTLTSISPDQMTLDYSRRQSAAMVGDEESEAGEEDNEVTEQQDSNLEEDASRLQLLAAATPSPEPTITTTTTTTTTTTAIGQSPGRVVSIDLGDVENLKATLEMLRSRGMLDRIVKEFGYQKSEEVVVLNNTTTTTPSAPSSVVAEVTKEVKCEIDDCNKVFSRPCELKKHQKRHAKPYACTFSNCDKRFGSKNDWKRHENSQHFQLEIWRCTEQVFSAAAAGERGYECGKVCHRRESLKGHLERDHQFRDEGEIERKLNDYRHGRNFESRFWCGFCVKTVEPIGVGGPAHSERFDHIDCHFMGKGGFEKVDIGSWRSLEMVGEQEVRVGGGGGGTKKRGREEDGGDVVVGGGRSGKRSRGGRGRGEMLWTCCNCGAFWNFETTNQCMDTCSHTQCRNCRTFENEATNEEMSFD